MASPSNVSSLMPAIAPNQSIYEESTTQEVQLGTRTRVGERQFVYCVAGANLSAGDVVATPAATYSAKQTAGAAAVVGTTSVAVYIANSVSANLLAEGMLVTQDLTGQGYAYKIKSHAAIGDTSAGTVKIYDGLAAALGSASVLSLIPSPYKNVTNVINGTTPCIGVAPIAVTSGNYFWAQVNGPTAIKVNTTVAYGSILVPATTGGVSIAAASANAFSIGLAQAAGTTGDTVPALLQISNEK